MKKATCFVVLIFLLTACQSNTAQSTENPLETDVQPEIEKSSTQSDYSIVDGRIYKPDGEELTQNIDFVTLSECQMAENEVMDEGKQEEMNAFSDYKLYDDSHYLAASFMACLCEADCSIQDVYIFDLETQQHITHQNIAQAISDVDSELGDTISRCHQMRGETDGCIWYQIENIEEDIITLNLLENDPKNQGTAVYGCQLSLYADFKYSLDEVKTICGFRLIDTLQIENFSSLFDNGQLVEGV